MSPFRMIPLSAVALLYFLTAGVTGRAVNISNTWMLPEEGFPVFYRYFRDGISWTEADAVCQFHHANLVTVDSTSQYDAVRAYLKELDIASNVWIGLSRSADKPNFTWRDFRPLSLTDYWQEAIPTGSDPLCAAMDPAADFRWHALGCSGPEVASFICELPVPSWANGPSGCLPTELPSLTVLYIPEQSAVELTSDCGLGGTKQISCKGKTDRDEMLRSLACSDSSGDLFDDKPQSTAGPVVNHESSTSANTNTAAAAAAAAVNTKTTKPWIWTSNTIDTGDYGLPTRHRRETDDTPTPSSVKSTAAFSHPKPTTPLTPLAITLATTAKTARSTTRETTEQSASTANTNEAPVEEITTVENGKVEGEEFPSVINQGQLFSIIENGTMFDIIELNNTTNDQEEVHTQSTSTVVTTYPTVRSTAVPDKKQLLTKKKKKVPKADDTKELLMYPIIRDGKLNRTFRKQVPAEKPDLDIMEKEELQAAVVAVSASETNKRAMQKSVEIRIHTPQLNESSLYVSTRVNAGQITAASTAKPSSSAAGAAATERGDLKDPDLIKSTASSQVQESTEPIKNTPSSSSSSGGTTESSKSVAMEFDAEPTMKPNRQRQLTRPQRRSFYPYFFSRVLG